jgi:2'-5' RNA ligase
MYVCFALLLPYDIQNEIRKIILQMGLKYSLDLVTSLLPQHISLKISFKVSEIERIEEYFDALAKDIKRFTVSFSKVDLLEFEKDGKKQGLLWLDVEENKILKELHKKLNEELKEKFDIGLACFDGDVYHFHSTLFHNGLKYVPFEAYEQAYSELKEMDFKKSTEVNEIAMFISNNDEEIMDGTFITYKVLSLKK